MPLLAVSANGNQADHWCGKCGNERAIPKGQWILDGAGTFTSPPCSICGAQETFLWHDWVYQSERRRVVPVRDEDGNPRRARDPETREEANVTTVETEVVMDPEHFGAEQEVLIGEVCQALGLSRQRRGNGEHAYPTPPKRPTKERVRERFQAS